MRRALGTTSTSAYYGDKGKIAYDHSQAAHAPAGAQANVIQTITYNGSLLTPDGSKNVSFTELADADLIAAIEGLSYAITYELDGGVNDVGNPATFTYSDLPITLLPATKNLYTFNGWFAEVGLTTPVTSFTTLGAKTVYAKFTLI